MCARVLRPDTNAGCLSLVLSNLSGGGGVSTGPFVVPVSYRLNKTSQPAISRAPLSMPLAVPSF